MVKMTKLSGDYQIFASQLSKERVRLVNTFKDENTTIKQIKRNRERIKLITKLMDLYTIGVKENSRREQQIAKILKRYECIK